MKSKIFPLFAAGTLLSLLCFSPLAQAQIQRGAPGSTGTNPTSRNGQNANGNKNQRRAACMKQAGVSKSAVEQHRAVMEQTRSKVAAVCGNSSLTRAQKKQQIQQIRQSARQQEQGLLSQQQISSFESCMRGGATAGGHPHGGASSDPCAAP